MNVADEIKFHSDRAMTELDMAVRAGHPIAARAHLALSALHLERMRNLCQIEAPEPELRMVG
jgi:hypothetical protein